VGYWNTEQNKDGDILSDGFHVLLQLEPEDALNLRTAVIEFDLLPIFGIHLLSDMDE
jgi:hypothetical protein